MKLQSILFSILFVLPLFVLAQDTEPMTQKTNKGDMYVYWGWNRGYYSPSTIRFEGDGFDFKLHKVKARDRQTPFSFDVHLNPAKATIPQYNFRVGYFFKDKWYASFGIDHMKYVVAQGQTTRITGEISNSGTIYDGLYTEDDIVIKNGFLKLEHTDGLNYAHFGVGKYIELMDFKEIKINLILAADVGIIVPKSDVTLLNNQRSDRFHLAGYGLDMSTGINILFFEHFFIQSELKGGFIHLPSIRITSSKKDRASQAFLFYQSNILFGAKFGIGHK